MENAKPIEMLPVELDILEADEDRPALLCVVVADGATPAEFFGEAVVEGNDEDGDCFRDWYVWEARCPFREEAIAALMEVWAEHFGPIARFEVDAVLTAQHGPVTYTTAADRKGGAQ